MKLPMVFTMFHCQHCSFLLLFCSNIQVIGLDKYGYGRILGQCMYGAKIYYCLWLHLSKPTDPFIIKPYVPCSSDDALKAKTLIVGKSNKEIVEVYILFFGGEGGCS